MSTSEIQQIEAEPDRLIVSTVFSGVSAGDLFAYFIDPVLLTRWWPEEAHVDAQTGGIYHMMWPQMEWTMRGSIRKLETGRVLSFDWKWDHEPQLPNRIVDIRFEPTDESEGTRMFLTHHPYGTSESEQEDRASHLDGWQYFLGRLLEITR